MGRFALLRSVRRGFHELVLVSKWKCCRLEHTLVVHFLSILFKFILNFSPFTQFWTESSPGPFSMGGFLGQ